MSKYLYPFIIILIIILSNACQKPDPDYITVSGKLIKLDTLATTFQYGTHLIAGYAAKSSTLNLDNYLDINITASGYKVDGYPVDGGPEYIDIDKIE